MLLQKTVVCADRASSGHVCPTGSVQFASRRAALSAELAGGPPVLSVRGPHCLAAAPSLEARSAARLSCAHHYGGRQSRQVVAHVGASARAFAAAHPPYCAGRCPRSHGPAFVRVRAAPLRPQGTCPSSSNGGRPGAFMTVNREDALGGGRARAKRTPSAEAPRCARARERRRGNTLAQMNVGALS